MTGRNWRGSAPWLLVAGAIAAVVALPLAVVLGHLAHPEPEIWQHLVEHVLAGLFRNTLALTAGVSAGVFVLGVSTAWLTAACDFPGRRFFSWALLLPMAMPAYVLAFVFVALLEYAGPVQTALRGLFGPEYRPWPVRSTGGVIVVMSLALYPYVYLLARNAFLTQGRRAMEAARTLGLGPVRGFFLVSLPLARPWIAAGVLLALMETLADFGTVAVFNYDTFTTAIYKTWFGLFSLAGASQLASILVLLAFLLILAEQYSRRRLRFVRAGRNDGGERLRLSGTRALAALLWCALVLAVAFVIPVSYLVLWAIGEGSGFDRRYPLWLGHTLALATLAALATAAVALLLGYARRQRPRGAVPVLARVATLGYALPGPVLAVGIVVPVAWVDGQLRAAGVESITLQGSLLVMLMAYLARFLAVGSGPLDSAMERITRNIDEAARSLGSRGFDLLRRVHVPMLGSGLFTAMALVFVDVMKEMPITLMTRPFGWDTLAVRIFEMTSEGQWEEAALPAVVLVAVGLLPIALLVLQSERSDRTIAR